MSKILDDYLLHLSESKFSDKLKDFLASAGILIGPVKTCKRMMKEDKYIYLYHGTRPEYVNSIKRNGLSTKHFRKRTKDEGDIMFGSKPKLYFGNVYTGKQAGFGTAFEKKGIKYLIAKLDSKFLKSEFGGFVYFKDVPPSDIIWDDDKRFHSIGKESQCLVQYGKGRR